MKDKHQKHPPLKRPTRGHYHQTEWAIYGTTCGAVELFYKNISSRLAEYKLTYVDADHSAEAHGTDLQIGKKKYSSTNTIHWNEYDDRLQPWSTNAVFVNGNHYPAQKQIVILNSKKIESLKRRVDQLTDVDLVITSDDNEEIYDFLKPKLNNDTKVLQAADFSGLISHLSKQIAAAKPPLKAVILAGGKSTRMGTDKATLAYHGKSQQTFMAEVCQSLGMPTYISKSHTDPAIEIDGFPVIKDKLVNMGPYGAIVSAMMSDPDAAWLVIACDLPYMDSEPIGKLMEGRKSSCHATAFKLKNQKFPEPLIAIYEPSIYQRMLRYLSLGYACPRKVLINSSTHILELDDDNIAFNANTKEERDQVLKNIK